MKKTLLTIALAALCLFSTANAQQIKPLNIGDTIPETLWNLSSEAFSRLKGKHSVSLNNYKSRFLILDFFSTWCGPCVRALPELEQVQNQFPEKVQIFLVTRGGIDWIDTFLKNNSYGKQSTLSFIVQDTSLNSAFPHRIIPHQVLIDERGIVKAITGSDGATMENVIAFFKGEDPGLPEKDDFKNNPKKYGNINPKEDVR